MNFLLWVLVLPRKFFYFFIFLYQKIFSPDHSFWAKVFFPHGYCKYYPSCSEYGKLVFKKKGVVIGLFLVGWRILRCNPWSKGGIDLP